MVLRVTCVGKNRRGRPHERIRKIGGRNNDDGSGWWLTLDEAISGIESGRYSFYVQLDDRSLDVLIAEHKRRPYLKTTADDYSPDTLLSLPGCL